MKKIRLSGKSPCKTNHATNSKLGKKSADDYLFSSKANMFIKHFNIHQKIPLCIIQELFLFFFQMRVECTRLSYLQPKSPATKSRGDGWKHGQDKRDDWSDKAWDSAPTPPPPSIRFHPAWNPSNDPPWWLSTWRAQLSLWAPVCLCMRRRCWNTAPPSGKKTKNKKEEEKKKDVFLGKTPLAVWRYEKLARIQHSQ